jgi:hypothetical protein
VGESVSQPGGHRGTALTCEEDVVVPLVLDAVAHVVALVHEVCEDLRSKERRSGGVGVCEWVTACIYLGVLAADLLEALEGHGVGGGLENHLAKGVCRHTDRGAVKRHKRQQAGTCTRGYKTAHHSCSLCSPSLRFTNLGQQEVSGFSEMASMVQPCQ